jgi:hypothetical protein
MSDAKDIKKDDGGIPPHLINEVGEHTIGGFLIFYFNSKTGQPEHIMVFDTPAHCLGLQKYISDWSEALHNVNVDNAETAIKIMEAEFLRQNQAETLGDEDEDDNEGDGAPA